MTDPLTSLRRACLLSLLMLVGQADRVRADIVIPATANAHISALNSAVEFGDTATVKALLAFDPTLVNSHDTHDPNLPGVMPLHIAVFWHRPDMIALLLANKADINGKDAVGRRPLHIAVRDSQPDTVLLLLADGADIAAPTDSGRTPLREALVDGDLDIAKMLVSHHAQSDIYAAAALGQTDQVTMMLRVHPEQASARDDLGQTPLHWASHYGRADTAALLLTDSAVRVNIPDDAGETLLHWAAMGGWDDNTVLKLLLAHGADVNARNRDGDTPLLAAFEGPSFAPVTLITHGADVTIHGKNGMTALHYAWFDHDDITQGRTLDDLLIAHGADVNARDARGQTPLHMAANSDEAVWASYLLSRGADVNAPNAQGETPLHLAAQADRQKSAAVLLAAKGVAVNAVNSQGQTPLYQAAQRGYQATARLLLAANADVNARSADGTTPLDAAVLAGHKMAWDKNGQREMADMLLSRGAKSSIFASVYYGETSKVAAFLKADPSLANTMHEGTTPLHLAAEQGDAPLAALLLAHGADVNGVSTQNSRLHQTEFGMTPLMLAAESGNVAVVKLLLAHGAETQAPAPNTYAGGAAGLAHGIHRGEIAALIRQQNLRK